MARLMGVDIPNNKQVMYSLQYIYGIGKSTAGKICQEAKVNPMTKVSNLTEKEFVAIREDCMFLRDMGTNGLNTATAITNAASLVTNKSKFMALYCQYYDIKDPYTYKQMVPEYRFH